MKIVGLNYTKISGEKQKKAPKSEINTNVSFTEITKEDVAIKDQEVASISFVYTLSYRNKEQKDEKLGNVEFKGTVTISLSAEESKEMWKLWKKKEMPNTMRLPIFNFILRKCTAKALTLQDELGLPTHIPLPRFDLEEKK